MTNVEHALSLIQDGQTLGLGSGAASEKFIHALGAKVQAGMKVRGVPTSNKSAELAKSLGIPLVSLEEGMPLDLAFDGADEVDPQLNMIKGYGRALIQEKIVAAAAKVFVILIGPERVEEKQVEILGQRGKLPVEVVPFALALCMKRLQTLGFPGDVYKVDGKLFVSDNGNYIIDCQCPLMPDPVKIEQQIMAIPGVVGTGLFLGMADLVLIQNGDRLEIRKKFSLSGMTFPS